MSTYIISFDVASEASKKALKDVLKSYGNYCPVHPACWAIVSNEDAVAIRDRILNVIGPSDHVFVVRSGTEAAWQNSYGPKNDNWLKSNL